MGRTFTFLLILVVIINLSVGFAVYRLFASEMADYRKDAALNAVNGLASNLESQIDLLSRSLDKIAENPAVISAVDRGEPAKLKQTAASLENFIPGIMKIRLLLPETNELDHTEIPHLGYADLDLVRESFSSVQPPMVQGAEGPNRHLAITKRINKSGRVIGVLLASMHYDFLNKTVEAAAIQQGLVELKQGDLTLAFSGAGTLKPESGSRRIQVAGTGWALQYWLPENSGFDNIYWLASIFLISALLACLAFFIGFRNLNEMIHHDQRSILKAVKDLITGKFRGDYPVKLNEMRTIISTVVQFKRVVDDERNNGSKQDSAEWELDSFFKSSMDESNDISQDQTIQKTGIPVVLPETASVKSSRTAVFDLHTVQHEKQDQSSVIYRAYDIRGIVGKTLTKEIVYDIGRALGSEAAEKNCQTVIVARDGRNSSQGLCESLAQGILTTGRNVIDLGRVPTPVLYFVAHHHEGHTGAVITGSHNPADYNGIKIVLNDETLAGEKILRLKQRIDNGHYSVDGPGKLETNTHYINEYIGTITDDVHLARPMKIVVDCGNGVAGELGPTLLRTMGCEIIELFCEIDGNFPNHHPDPSQPENLGDLITAVQHYQADLGIAFDGDGDRLGIVDSNGKIIWPDRLMMLFSKQVLKSNPGAEIIYDVKCSSHLENQITKNGGRPLIWKTGHSLMKAKLRETGAKLAGEMSGHIFFNDRWFGFDDALYSAARLIEILSEDARSSSEVFSDLPDGVNTPEMNIDFPEGEHFIFIKKLLDAADFSEGKVTDIDGLRVDYPYGWGLVRASNTTPSVVLRFEADSKQKLLMIQDRFKKLMTGIKPDIAFPF